MTQQEQTTIIGVFKDHSAAQQASVDLVASGIPSNSINIQSDAKTMGAGQAESTFATGHHEGGFSAWISSLFGNDSDSEESKTYEDAYRTGRAILSVTVSGAQVSSAVDILNDHGVLNVDKEEDSEYDKTTTTGATSIPVVEEELLVGKRTVQRGGVRVYSRVTERPIEEQVNLREERVRVERHAVDRPVTDVDLNRLQNQTIEVAELAEEPVISKRARVVEEVSVGKEENVRTETIQDKVRHTEVDVEELPATSAPVDYTPGQKR